jgi:hypothetical protein
VAAEFYDPSKEDLDGLAYKPPVPGSYNSLEKAVYGDETEYQMAQRIFRQAAPASAKAIVDIALNGMNERTKLQAATYVVERLMGKVPDAGSAGSGNDILASVLADMEQELKANGSSPGTAG